MLYNPAERFRNSDAQPLFIDLKKILIATDGSDSAIKATKYAIGMAKFFKAKVRAIFVDDGTESDELSSTGESNGLIGLSVARQYASQNGVSCDELVVRGSVAKKILAETKEYLPDLIIMGNSGKTGFLKSAGSIVDIVMNGTEIPVLIVKTE